MYDLELMKEEIEPFTVAKHLGVKMGKRGKNIFIECPEHEKLTGKADRRISNCILGNNFNNAYYCFSCGARGSLVQMVAGYLGLNSRSDFRQILKIINEAGGNHYEKQCSDNSWKLEKEKRKEELVLSSEEMGLLGVGINPWVCGTNEIFSEDELGEEKEFYKKKVKYEKKAGELTKKEWYEGKRKEKFDLAGCRAGYIAMLGALAEEEAMKYEKISKMDAEELMEIYGYEGDPFPLRCALEEIRRRKENVKEIERSI